MIVLFDDMRAPARDASRGEGRRVQLWREAKHGENRRCIKIDIRAKLLLAFHRFLEVLTDRHPLLLPDTLPKVARDLAHYRHARIALFINSMTESHDFRFLRELFFQPAFGALRRLDFVEHFHRLFVSAAM